MAIRLLENIQEARRASVSPGRDDAAVLGRQGFVSGVPLGGATDINQGAGGSIGSLDRRSFMQQLLQSYLSCPPASACVDVIARTCTAGGLEATPIAGTTDKGKIPTPPPDVQDVQELLKYVNPYDDIRQLMRGVVSDLLIFGDAFIEVVFLMGKPLALYPLDPSTMLVLADEHGVVNGYSQQMDTGRSVRFDPFEVIHIKLDTPKTSLYGTGPTQKAVLPITIWLYIAALMKETMKRGDPLRAHVDWSVALPESEIKRFQQQYASRNLGARNIGNLFETKGNTQVKELAVNQIEKWMNLSDLMQSEILSEYGTPPHKIGLVTAGLGSGSVTPTLDRQFLVNTCGPLQELVLEKLTFALLVQAWGNRDWRLHFGEVDWRDDLTVEQIRDMRIRNGSWTIDRARSVIGEPPIKGGDQAVLVDRSNMLLWADMPALSKANVAAVQAKGAPLPQLVGGKANSAMLTQSTDGAGSSMTRTPAARTPKAPRPPNAPTPPGAESLRESWSDYLDRRQTLLGEWSSF